jgi:hypothetical protein
MKRHTKSLSLNKEVLVDDKERRGDKHETPVPHVREPAKGETKKLPQKERDSNNNLSLS